MFVMVSRHKKMGSTWPPRQHAPLAKSLLEAVTACYGFGVGVTERVKTQPVRTQRHKTGCWTEL